MRQTLIGQDDIFLSDIDLLFGCVEIEKCRTDVVVNLAANVFRFRLSLPERRFSDTLRPTTSDRLRRARSSSRKPGGKAIPQMYTEWGVRVTPARRFKGG